MVCRHLKQPFLHPSFWLYGHYNKPETVEFAFFLPQLSVRCYVACLVTQTIY